MKRYFTEGIILAGIPLLAYVYTYTFNSGYGSFFHIPPELISFSLPSIISTLLATAVGLGTAAGLFMGMDLKKYATGAEALIQNLAILCILGVGVLVLSGPIHLAIGIFIFSVIVGVIHLALPIRSQRSVFGYANKVEAHINHALAKQRQLSDVIFDSVLYGLFTLVLLFVGSCILSYCVGIHTAKLQENYYVLSNNPNWIVVRFIDNSAVLEERDGAQLTGKLKLINLQGDMNGATILEMKHLPKLQQPR